MSAARLAARCAVGLLVLLAATGCSRDGRDMAPPSPDQTQSIIDTTVPTTVAVEATFTLSGPWAEGGAIDLRHGCRGEDRSPALSWAGTPAGTAELALVVTDPDADGFVHWVLTGIPPVLTAIGEGETPAGATAGRNDFGTTGWRGPCPPSGTHTYAFRLYALPEPLGVTAEVEAREVIAMLDASSIAEATLTGTYSA